MDGLHDGGQREVAWTRCLDAYLVAHARRSLAQHEHTVGQLCRLLDVVGHEHDRARLLLQQSGQFSAEAEALRLYRHIATLDPSAPVPALPDREPDWRAGGAAAEKLGLGRLAGRLEEAASS